MLNKFMFKKYIVSCLLMAVLVGCADENQIKEQDIVSTQDDVIQDVTQNEEKEILKSDIYELYPVGKMYGKTTEEFKAELSKDYEIVSAEQDGGYVKHLIMFDEEQFKSFDAVLVVTDENDVVVLVTYNISKTITDNYDEDLKGSVDDIKAIYDILEKQGEELELVYSKFGTNEEGTIVDLVEDFNSDNQFVGGNYESRFNLDGVEVEIGILYMLEPTSKEGVMFQTLTFEEYLEEQE